MNTTEIITFIDDWLSDQGWKLNDNEIDFALDVRRMIAEIDSLDENDEAELVSGTV